MRKEVHLSSLDLTRAIFYLDLRNKFLWGLSLLCSLFIHFLSFIGLWAMDWPLEETMYRIFAFILWIIVLKLAGTLCTLVFALPNPKWRKGRVGKHIITITKDELIEETDFNKSHFKWNAISSIEEIRGLLFIRHSGTDVFAVPKKSFATNEEWNKFVGTTIDFFNSSRSVT